MSWLLRKLMWWVQGRQKEDELREEPLFHLEAEADERRSRGLSDDQALRAARVDLGNVTIVREDARSLWTWTFIEQLAQDTRYALRSLRRSPGFGGVAGFNGPGPATLVHNGASQAIDGSDVTWNFLSLLGVPPVIGRDFAGTDADPGAPAVAILSHEFWQGALAAIAGLSDGA